METKINTYIPYGKCFINNNIGNRVGELNDYLECNEYLGLTIRDFNIFKFR